MKKEEVIEILQTMARKTARKGEVFRFDKLDKFVEYMSVERAVNVKIQELIDETEKSELSDAINDLEYSLYGKMEFYKNFGIVRLAELCAVAIGAVRDMESAIKDYLKEEKS